MIKLGIVGLGLIGSSILKTLANNGEYEIYCYSNSNYKNALKYCNCASNNLEIVKECNIVFVCSKVDETLNILNILNNILSKNAIVADVASIKKDLLNKKFNFEFVLSHPMAGTEKTGFDAGFNGLFDGAKWLVEKENAILKKVINDLGAKEILVDMTQHDYLCAQISHLPTILSFLLFDSVSNNAKIIASSGFRDTTRLAMTNSNLAFNMFSLNQENILKAFDLLIQKLDSLKKMSDDEKINLFTEIAKNRLEMYDENGKNIFNLQ